VDVFPVVAWLVLVIGFVVCVTAAVVLLTRGPRRWAPWHTTEAVPEHRPSLCSRPSLPSHRATIRRTRC